MAKVITYFSTRASGLASAVVPRLNTTWRYARAELRPPTFSEFPEIGLGIKKLIHSARTQGYRNLTIREAWLNTLVGAEIAFWFFAGECIGKGSVVGYDIPGAVNWELQF
ncbi:unnamed protein product [Candidula unifasciata]|uniref:ATP synthase subunit n=1 Tax=Candidula unifasciata TaxID=100452 RepID=A0A8S4A2Y9_9EUPU|nr:unnamed protein product [Candidula unifasciata]